MSGECSSWNCCDDLLRSCIDRSKDVKKIRAHLKEKKYKTIRRQNLKTQNHTCQ
ncbi:MAG: hypothetical protein ACXABO_14095 [Promethearchaeota archaeon]